MIYKLPFFSALVFVSLISSCATDVANRYYGAEKYAAKEAGQVELLFKSPSRPYTVIADFQSRGESPQSVRKKAAKIGADAVIISMLGGFYNTQDQWAGTDSMSHTYSHITGTAIKYK